jgi:uncharacterized delta-60 repeat protein
MKRLSVVLASLVACASGGDPSSATVGPAGGTVRGPSGAQVVIPAGALAREVAIAVSQASAGAPPLPGGTTPFGSTFAFTPHGTTFLSPVTITVPFDPAQVPAGATPTLYKTTAGQAGWEVVAGATVSGATMSGPVTQFSYAVVAPPPVAAFPEYTEKAWDLQVLWQGGSQGIDQDQQVGGLVDRSHLIGRPLPIYPAGQGPEARVAAYVNGPGTTYWTSAQAPHSFPGDAPEITGSSSALGLAFRFQKNAADATLSIQLTESLLEFLDYGGAAWQDVCTWLDPATQQQSLIDECVGFVLDSQNEFALEVVRDGYDEPYWGIGGVAYLTGVAHAWRFSTFGADQPETLWADADFEVTLDLEGDGRHARVRLVQPIHVDVPLEHVELGQFFNVYVGLTSLAANLRQGEIYAGAYLRDPLGTGGTQLSFTGLTQWPMQAQAGGLPEVPPCAGGPDPAAGTVQFAAADFRAPEWPGGGRVVVERTGGTRGEVSVRVESADGTAQAGPDYQPVSRVVRFADGKGGQRIVRVGIATDSVAEADETVQLGLTPVGGCAGLGAQATATLTILDDDRRVVGQAFTVGGAVAGLAGSGLVLRELYGGATLAPANGPFTLPGTRPDGALYDVRVDAQPTGPAQDCVVTSGSGRVAGANVTDVAVACTTLPTNGALDPTFGTGGILSTSLPPAAAVAVQPDGGLLVLGGLKLARFLAGGAPDVTFGTSGVVSVTAGGGSLDATQALALQPDGKILVAGYGTTGSGQDFALLRYLPDGSLDTGFGTGGVAWTDFAGSTDRAYDVAVQPDGKIVVAGYATFTPTALPDSDFAVARYLADGSPDTAFGAGGTAHAGIAGRVDFGYAVGVQSDGGIVVAGRAGFDGGSDPDFGIVRFDAAGILDPAFGTAGVVRVDLAGGLWNEAADLAIQPDGRIVVSGLARPGGVYVFTTLRLLADGTPDASFGVAGAARTGLGGNDFGRAVALQADGRIVVVGQSSTGGGDFGVVRYAADGTLDPSLGGTGTVTVDFFGAADGASAVAIQADGRILVAGAAQNGSTTGLGLARLMP